MDFQPLVITQARLEARDVISVTMADPSGKSLPPWSPGAHVNVRLPSGQIRQYSLCGDPDDPMTYTIAIKREPQPRGRGGSVEAHNTALAGSTWHVAPPRNHFALGPAEQYLFLAGGIGVTPILAMIRRAVRDGSPWALHYGGRTAADMAFTQELQALGGSNVHVHPEDIDAVPDLQAIVRSAPPGTTVYCCGPEPMLRAAESVCEESGVPLHLERFSGGTRSPDAAASAGEFDVELARTGRIVHVASDSTLLDALRDVVPDLPYSCEEGYCGACETRVLAGTPDHHDDVLTPEEQESGDMMMICVGRSLSETLVLDI
ncbi:PDR/VanB family oxidoreductase [Streptomyces sp. NBC_00063]|uniref:PDR/VanB family oxidoreductase n=1 Tax=Streptomyces sp. NBC_00063 TaxID=2975638 RepID=UPI003D759698